LKRTDPDVGEINCMIARQTVDFPQPDSPTSTDRFPVTHHQADAVDGLDLRDFPVDEHTGLDREVFRPGR
jgi:hypothetical protein